MSLSIQHLPELSRFQAVIDGHTCLIDYRLENNVMHVLHTLVPQEVGGRGIAAELTRFALETASSHHWKVHPVCSYTVTYLKRHPEYTNVA
ncbi:MAG: GNAT family N-acetyltransferase [Advenella sp.]|nr:GNAT family N-acetyltransferase [Advenella sp.]